jgi:hypothetical protein
VSAAKLCVHDNGVAVRNPHGDPLMPLLGTRLDKRTLG